MTNNPDPPAIGWTADDALMAELRAWLVERGFIVLRDRYDADHFGDQEVLLSRPIAIRLVRDRGEWDVEVVGSDGQWTRLQSWRDALRGREPDVLSTADQAALLREMLDELERHPSPPGL